MPPEVTDREILLWLADMVGALAMKLTGERPSIRINSEALGPMNLYPLPHVTWLPVPEDLRGFLVGCSSTQVTPSALRPDTPIELPTAQELLASRQR
jgi:hypothetical protein